MYKWIWGYIKKYRFWMATGLTLSAIVAAMNVINPIITGNIVDKVIGDHMDGALSEVVIIYNNYISTAI